MDITSLLSTWQCIIILLVNYNLIWDPWFIFRFYTLKTLIYFRIRHYHNCFSFKFLGLKKVHVCISWLTVGMIIAVTTFSDLLFAFLSICSKRVLFFIENYAFLLQKSLVFVSSLVYAWFLSLKIIVLPSCFLDKQHKTSPYPLFSMKYNRSTQCIQSGRRLPKISFLWKDYPKYEYHKQNFKRVLVFVAFTNPDNDNSSH